MSSNKIGNGPSTIVATYGAGESTKRSQKNFRVFQLSCFRDKIRRRRIIKCKGSTTETLSCFCAEGTEKMNSDPFLIIVGLKYLLTAWPEMSILCIHARRLPYAYENSEMG